MKDNYKNMTCKFVAFDDTDVIATSAMDLVYGKNKVHDGVNTGTTYYNVYGNIQFNLD